MTAGVYVAKPGMPSLSSFSIRGFLALVLTFASGIWIKVRVEKLMPRIGNQCQLECCISPHLTKGLVIKLFEATPTRTLISAIWEILGVSRFIGQKTTVLYHQVASIEVQKL